MIIEQLKELAAAKTKIAQLEKVVADELRNELRELPARYGFDSADAFTAAVRAASGKRRGRKPGAAKSVATAPTTGGKRRKRATITDATRAEVKKLVEAGKTGPEIAQAVGISEPSVFNVKKALGLVKKRK